MIVAFRAISSLFLLFTCAPILSLAILPRPKRTPSNPLGIDWDPAPSPEDGPPLSANASRDKSLLPAQISAIVGSYVFCVCLVGLILLILNRRLRRQLQKSTGALDIELVHRPGYLQTERVVSQFDPSPISPASPGGPRNFSWPSPDKAEPNPYVYPPTYKKQLPVNGNPFVDDRVVQADREMLDRDLEDIYAHVMEQEEAKAKGIILKDVPVPLRSPLERSPVERSPVERSPVEGGYAEPPRQNTLQKKQSKSWLRKSEKNKPANLSLDDGKSSKPHSRSSSILSALRSPGRKSRPMQISSPMPTPLSATFPSSNSDEEPLTPRYYHPPPPPPIPRDQVPYVHTRKLSSTDQPASPTQSIAEKLAPHVSSPRQPQHRVNISTASTMRSSQASHDPVSATSATSQTPLVINTPHAQAAAQIGRSLPFRQYEPALASPSFASQSTKTTVLERTNPRSPGLNSGLRTPWSAGAVPYSPYQPFTPMMPITPTLVTKAERKAKEKQQKKKPVLELIKSEDEIWDSGY
ncbi:hypothetical protein PVAG01_07322 [Phlyctema vagabunda]|uniref:Uncharacterized protein n=1 Tax=Phlyctema vagabunda TaxID=108571 RepID=A0ABR4PCJ4_9HELO